MNFLFHLKENILYYLDKLLKRPNIVNGFKYKSVGKQDYIFGAVDKKPVMPGGNWKVFRPEGELQRKIQETMACVSFSACNCIEIIINNIILSENRSDEENEILEVFANFGLIENIERDENGLIFKGNCNASDRYVAKTSNTSVRGNNQYTVAMAIRKNGLVPEEDWPYVDGWSQYYKNIDKELIKKGKKLINYIEFNFEWVVPVGFKSALMYAPIQTSVFAWGATNNGIYQYTPLRRNHAVTHDGYKKDHKQIFDSYKPFDKKVVNNYNLGNGMVFSIHLKKPFRNKYEKLLDKGHKFLIRPNSHGEFYKITKSGLEYIKDKNEIKQAISMETDLNKDLIELTDQKKILWIPEKYFNDLVS